MNQKRGVRKKKGKLVIPFLYVDTIGVNGVDMPDPYLFSAEMDQFPVVSKRLKVTSEME